MGKFSLIPSLPGVSVLVYISFTLLFTLGATKELYFHPSKTLSWDDARKYCQKCFKDLATVTSGNTGVLLKNAASESWIGLRKHFNSAGNPSVAWSRWANMDPISFQNWYQGHPMSKPSPVKTTSCSCSCTCPATPSLRTTPPNLSSSTAPIVTNDPGPVGDSAESGGPGVNRTSECTCSPMLTPEGLEAEDEYVEDSCVAMLPFGPWIEKHCGERLPFVCYEDLFMGKVDVTDITTSSATLAWLRGPGDITHYRVEVTDHEEPTTHLNVNSELVNLTAGTFYSVQVFPVKCDRDLNPQAASFYTTPDKVENLKVVEVTERSISLSWDRPGGNVNFYRIHYNGKTIQDFSNEVKVEGLTPGSSYTFVVSSGVNGSSRFSEGSTVTNYTKPGRVSNLKVSDNSNSSVLLSWEPPQGFTTGFLVRARSADDSEHFQAEVTESTVQVINLPPGCKIQLSVMALIHKDLQGDEVDISTYTVPAAISGLRVKTESYAVTVQWDPISGTDVSFTAELLLGHETKDRRLNLKENRVRFEELQTGAEYTVVVYALSGGLRGPASNTTIQTQVLGPSEISTTTDKHSISVTWKAPANAASSKYQVNISSSFWGQSFTKEVSKKNKHTFQELKSGTNYTITVQAESRGKLSSATSTTSCTVPEIRLLAVSMLCSSATSLLCDNSITRKRLFNELEKHLFDHLGEDVYWKLEKKET